MINKTIELASELQNKIVQNISRHEKSFSSKNEKTSAKSTKQSNVNRAFRPLI